MMQFLLDDIIFDSPKGWEDIETTIKRDFQYNAVLANQDTEVDFTGEAYDYLYTKLRTDGFCTRIKFEVRYSTDGLTYATLLRGNLFLSDIQFNERTCTATVKIEDNSYYAMINNNKGIKTPLDSGRSKNGVNIQTPPVYQVDFQNIVALTIARANVNCYRVYDAFEYLIKFMSDGRLQFASDYLQTTAFTDPLEGALSGFGWKGLCITTGINIRVGTTINDFSLSQFSFDDLWKEINRRIPLVLIVENPYSENPTIRIEDINYQYTNATVFTASDVYEIISKVDTKSIYAKVNVGSKVVDNQGLFPEQIHFFGFGPEEYIVQGECNIDTALELGTDWATSSNVIAQSLNGVQDYDTNLFLIETEYFSPTSGETWNFNNLGMIGPPVYYYFNTNLTNSYILSRYRGGIPGDLSQYTGVKGDGEFLANEPTAYPMNIPFFTAMNFTNVIFNNGGYYNGVDRFTAPIAGVYTFNIKSTVTSAGYTSALQNLNFNIRAFIYDVGGTVQSNNIFGSNKTQNQANPIRSYNDTESLILNDGWYVKFFWFASASIPAITAQIEANSSIECLDNSIGGGIFVTVDNTDIPIYLYEMEYPMCQDDFDIIMANTVGTVQFNMSGQPYRRGWISELTYNHTRGVATIKLISKNNGN
jgi:hypothetical protein